VRFSDIEAARKLLGLGETASLEQIRSAYRSMARQHHPDKKGTGDAEAMKEINQAYHLLMDICNHYRYSFRKEDLSQMFQLEEDLDAWRDRWAF